MSARWLQWPWFSWLNYLLFAGWVAVWIHFSIGFKMAFFLVIWAVLTAVFFHDPVFELLDKLDPSHEELEQLKAEMAAIRKDSIERDLRRD